jgi:hypothetical protein
MIYHCTSCNYWVEDNNYTKCPLCGSKLKEEDSLFSAKLIFTLLVIIGVLVYTVW